jgi:hypothetical protein
VYITRRLSKRRERRNNTDRIAVFILQWLFTGRNTGKQYEDTKQPANNTELLSQIGKRLL